MNKQFTYHHNAKKWKEISSKEWNEDGSVDE